MPYGQHRHQCVKIGHTLLPVTRHDAYRNLSSVSPCNEDARRFQMKMFMDLTLSFALAAEEYAVTVYYIIKFSLGNSEA